MPGTKKQRRGGIGMIKILETSVKIVKNKPGKMSGIIV